jgi:hypothetical protein
MQCNVLTVPPSIGAHDYEDRLVLRAGSAAAIEIPFNGSPDPTSTWKCKNGKLPDPKRFKTDTIRGMTSMTIAKTVRTDSGKYTLNLENEYGKANFAIELVVLDKPGPVQNLKVTETTENTVAMKWEDPEDDGGCIITGYVIEKREGIKRTFQRDGSSTEPNFQAIALTEGQSYVFRVAAENECGVGEFRELSKPIVPKSQYSKNAAVICLCILTRDSFSTRCSQPTQCSQG